MTSRMAICYPSRLLAIHTHALELVEAGVKTVQSGYCRRQRE